MYLGYFYDINLAGLGGCKGAQTTQAVSPDPDISPNALVARAVDNQETGAPGLLVTRHGFGRDVERVAPG